MKRIEKIFGCNNYSPLNIIISRAKGHYLWDDQGKRYLDCIAGYSSANFGHSNPLLIRAAVKQMRTQIITSRQVYNDKLAMASYIVSTHFGYPRVIFTNTGCEAVETAIKFARMWYYKTTGKQNSRGIFFKNNFHGRSITVCGGSEEDKRRTGFGPYMPGIKILDYNDSNLVERELKRSRELKHGGYSFILAEPVQGEGGIIIPSDTYFRDLRYLCDKYNVLLIADEVQTGMGRTGRDLCQDHYSIRADLTCLGKSLSGGIMPVSCVLGNNNVFDTITPGTHGSTWGGNPLACVLAMESVGLLKQYIDTVEEKGRMIEDGIKGRVIRRKGMMIGIVMDNEQKANEFRNYLLLNGIVTGIAGNNVIRITPPFTISVKDINRLVTVIN